MGLHDRPYWREGGSFYDAGGRAGRGVMIGMPRPGRAVKMLLIINLVVFVFQMIFDNPREGYRFGILSAYFGATPGAFWQLWRYVTFQFLHSTGDFFHILLNMLGLYMLGTPLEQQWGTRRFVRFYLICGAVAGVAYVIIGNVVGMADVPIVGASGGVFGVLLACAVLFPQFRLILFLFPVPIRFACVVIFGIMGVVVLQAAATGRFSPRFWSEVAHLGGAAAAACWIWALPKLRGAAAEARGRRNRGAWERKLRKRAEEQAEIDRILAKIHDAGLGSLSEREKKILREATRKQQEADSAFNRL